VVWGAL